MLIGCNCQNGGLQGVLRSLVPSSASLTVTVTPTMIWDVLRLDV